MGLTEEQKEQICRNRERALELRRQRQQQQEEQKQAVVSQMVSSSLSSSPNKRKVQEITIDLDAEDAAAKEKKMKEMKEKDKAKDVEEKVEVEQFEEGASDYVTKKEAMKMYCLPEGTIAVCSFIERENPRQKGWVPMKLYSRSEIRRRARERFDGMQGLIEERRKREQKRFENDLERTKDIFR
jgi:hypothetical protein